MAIETLTDTQVFHKKPCDFNSTLDVAACFMEHKDSYLILKRAPDKPEGNKWGLPAGKVESGETVYKAVLREVFEEVHVQLDENHVREVGEIYVRHPHIDFTFHMFHHHYSTRPPVLLSDEHVEYRWVTFEEANTMPLMAAAPDVFDLFVQMRATD